MASTQGICKNCGSLIIFNDREELCECLFCDCVFSSAEAIEIAKNPGAYTFPNEPQPARDGVKRYNVTPVYADPIPVAVKQAEVSSPAKKEKNPYEVSPDDIKPPRKALIRIIAVAAAFILVVVAIFLPLYLLRKQHGDVIAESIDQVFLEAEYSVNTDKADGYYIGFSLSGQKSSALRVATDDEITQENVYVTFIEYAALRGGEYEIDQSDFDNYYGDLSVDVIAASGHYMFSVDEESDLLADNVRVIE